MDLWDILIHGTVRLYSILLHGKKMQILKVLNLWLTFSIYGEHAQFMMNMLNVWWIYGKQTQFKLNMLNLWCTFSVYVVYAQPMVNMLNILIVNMLKILMMTMLWPLDQWLWKSFHCYIGLEKLTQNDSYIAKIHLLNRNMEMFFSMSADVYSDLTIQLALKNYQKMTLKLPKSIHWFKRYSEINFYVCWCVQWPHCWIGL